MGNAKTAGLLLPGFPHWVFGSPCCLVLPPAHLNVRPMPSMFWNRRLAFALQQVEQFRP